MFYIFLHSEYGHHQVEDDGHLSAIITGGSQVFFVVGEKNKASTQEGMFHCDVYGGRDEVLEELNFFVMQYEYSFVQKRKWLTHTHTHLSWHRYVVH